MSEVYETESDEVKNKRKEIRLMLESLMDPGAGVDAVDVGGLPMQIPEISGVDKVKAPASSKPKVTDGLADLEDAKDAAGKSMWLSIPTFDDQFSKYPTTCRLIGPTIALFDITDKGQLADLNKMLAKQSPVDAPGIILVNKEKNFHEGKWLVLLEYMSVEYKKLVASS